MIDFTYREAYVLSFVGIPKKNIKISTLSQIMLGLYVCDFLDLFETKICLNNKGNKGTLQNWVDEYFLMPSNVWDREDILLSTLEKLNQLKLLKIQKKKIFNHFSLIHCIDAFNFKNWSATPPTEARNDVQSLRESAATDPGYAGGFAEARAIQLSLMDSIDKKKSLLNPSPLKNLNKFILLSIGRNKAIENSEKLKEVIELFNKKLFSLFKDHKKSKYELRFFWPNAIVPEVYECIGSLFNEENYTICHTQDKYILKDEKTSLKLRKHQLHIKNFLRYFFKIAQFAKKRKIPFNKRFFENIFDKHIIPVEKERYITEIGAHSKIEFSIINVQGNEWKTICIESNKIEIVLALSFLVNQEQAEKLTYPEFLNKYSKVNS